MLSNVVIQILRSENKCSLETLKETNRAMAISPWKDAGMVTNPCGWAEALGTRCVAFKPTTLSAAPLKLYQSQAANRYGTWHDECISKDQYVFLSLPQLACSLSLIRDVQASSPAPTLLWFSVGLESSVTRGQLETHPLPEPSPSSPALHSPAQWLHNTRGLRHTMQHRCNSYHQSIHVPLLINQCTSVLWQDLTPTVTPTDCALLGVLGNVISRTDKTDAQETWDVLSSAMPMSEPHDCSRPKMSQTVTNYTSTQNASWFPKDVYTLLWNINTLTPPPNPTTTSIILQLFWKTKAHRETLMWEDTWP